MISCKGFVDAQDKSSVLIIADEWDPMQVLSERLQSEGDVQVRCIEQDGPDLDLAQFRAIFVYVHNVLEAYVEDALIDYALAGGRLIVLHHAIASAKVANPNWLDFVGIHIAPRDDPKHPWRVVEGTHTLINLQPSHYVTSHEVTYDRTLEYTSSDTPSAVGVYPALDLEDTEVFLNQHFTDGREKTVLFGFQITDPQTGRVYAQDRSGWYKPVGKGWLFYLQPGHTATDFQNQSFGQILLNCLRWEPRIEMVSLDDTATREQLAVLEGPHPTEPATYSALERDREEWLDISPGPNLEGWQEYPWPPGIQYANALPQEPPQWHMDVETGTLRCDGTTHTHLLTKTMYRDFVLHVEWRFIGPVENYNSGVFVRMVPGHRVMHQVETRRGKVGVIMGGTLIKGELTCLGVAQPGRSGQWRAVWPHVPQAWGKHILRRNPTPITKVPKALGPSVPTVVYPPGEWNTYEVTCKGSTIVVRTNKTVSSITDNCAVMEGAIGLESEGYAIEFRNMRVKLA